MKSLCFFIGCCIFSIATAQTEVPKYDAALAQKLGADDYGMKTYVLVILQTGSKDETDAEKRKRLFEGHQNNIRKLAEAGKLVVAGPFMQNQLNYRGLFILNTSSLDEAKLMLQDDPTISEGIFEVTLLPWYGSAALGEYLPFHSQIEKIKP